MGIRRKSCDGYESSRSTIGTIKIKASVEFNADTYDSHFSPPIVETVLSNFRRVDEVVKWRAAAALFISSIFFFRSQLDSYLVNLWTFLQNDSSLLAKIFRHDHWEWALAVGAFGIWIHGFWFADRLVDKANKKGINHPWKKYRLHDQYEEEKWRRSLIRRASVSSSSTGKDVTKGAEISHTKQNKWHLGFWTFELPLYCLPLYIWDKAIPRRAGKIAGWGAPTSLGICGDVAGALLLYDLGFFFCHLMMHKIPFFYKWFHAKHHIAKEVRASDIVRLSGVEEVVDVGISIIALNCLKAHPISRSLYNVIITFMLTELHSGFAFPWTPQFVVPFGLATGSKGHHYHHRYGKHYYQKFFCHVDRIFGFVQKRDGSLKGSTI